MPRTGPRGALLFVLPAAVGALVLLALAGAAWPFTVDDAFIVARYAERIAAGAGYTFQGASASDGVTGPLWLLPLVVGRLAGLDPLTLGKACSLAAALLALLAVCQRVRAASQGRRAVWLVPLLVCSSLPFVVWSVAGLETGLAALFATLLALSVTRRPRADGWLAGVAVAALAWLRPELLAFALCGLLILSVRERAALLRAALLGALGVALVCAFRLRMFGHLLPMSASAKPALLGPGLSYLGETLTQPRIWLLVLLLGCALLRPGARAMGGSEPSGARADAAPRMARFLILALAVHALAVVLAGGDWMPGRRLFAPLVPVLALALASGLRPWLARRPRLVWTLAALLLCTSARELVSELRVVREAGARRVRLAPQLAQKICAARGPVALVDLGVLAAACPAQSFLDLGGLTEPAIAYARGPHLGKEIDARWLEAQAPGLVVLHSAVLPRVDTAKNLRWFAGYPVERRVLSMGFMRNYEVQEVFAYAPHYFYVLLVPRERGAHASILRSTRAAQRENEL